MSVSTNVQHARDIRRGDTLPTVCTTPVATVTPLVTGIRVTFADTEFIRWFEPLEAVIIERPCDSCGHVRHEDSCVTDCPCRRGCPACAGHGVVFGVRMVEVRPGIYDRVEGDSPCMRCLTS